MAIQLPQAFIFMKVGHHSGESLESIMERKQLEITKAGRTFWGYGGTLLHPINQVQPFAKKWVHQEGAIRMLMQPTKTKTKTDPHIQPAIEFSVDRRKWEPLPSGIRVTGSRYAVVLDEIKPVRLELDLGQFEVGIGPSRGRNATQFVKARVDKGCFVAARATTDDSDIPRRSVQIGWEGRLAAPFAVFVS